MEAHFEIRPDDEEGAQGAAADDEEVCHLCPGITVATV